MSLFRAMAHGVCLLQTATALPKVRQLSSGRCSFASEPSINFFWDPRCLEKGTSSGCKADGINQQCRFCGAGEFKDIVCPVHWCEFDNPPPIPYYWESKPAFEGGCSMAEFGCGADGKHVECRFCGEYPYSEIPCPKALGAVITPEKSCKFDTDSVTPYFWDSSCEDGMLGCKADGINLRCRFCGTDKYQSVPCPAEALTR